MNYNEYVKVIPVVIEIVDLLKKHFSTKPYNLKCTKLPISNFFITKASFDGIRIKLDGTDIIRVSTETQSVDSDIPLALIQHYEFFCSSREHPGYNMVFSNEKDLDLLDPECYEEQLFQYSTAGYSDVALIALELEVKLQKILNPDIYLVMTIFCGTENDLTYQDYINLRDDLKNECWKS